MQRLPSTNVSKIKKVARTLAKKHGVQHNHALEIIVKALGFSDYHHYFHVKTNAEGPTRCAISYENFQARLTKGLNEYFQIRNQSPIADEDFHEILKRVTYESKASDSNDVESETC